MPEERKAKKIKEKRSGEIPRVSIIIPNYNSEAFLDACLDSLYKQIWKDFEVILVDNGSTDRSPQMAENHPLKPVVLRLDKNYGFAHAVNVGLEKSCAKLIALLNNDAQPDPLWLKNLVECAEQYPQMDFFASLVLRLECRDKIESAGVGWSLQARPIPLFAGKSPGRWLRDFEVFLASASAVLFRRRLLEKLGLFDEDYFAYLEDVGFFLKARLAGCRGMLVSKALVYHLGAGTELGDKPGKKRLESQKRVFLIARNRWWLIWDHLPAGLILLLLPLIAFGWLRGLGYHLFISGQIGAFLRGSLAGIFSFPSRRKVRKRVKGLWQIKSSELLKFMKKGFWEMR